ncbi:MAG: amidohydrolase family protein, partial [Propionibacteriaceae bacterium]|nr:amidohydrolase family protein [Propionibacteriaceae bacterium]
MALVIRRVRPVDLVGGRPAEPLDVAVAGGRITALGPNLARPAGADELDGDGRWLLPGLWDAHVHFRQWAAALDRLDLSGSVDAAAVVAAVERRLAEGRVPAILIGFGYRTPTWPVQPSVAALDAVTGDQPVVLFSGDLHSAWFNSAALRWAGVAPREDVIKEAELFELSPKLAAWQQQAGGEDLSAAQRDAAAKGVVGLVDFEFEPTFETWPARYADVGLLKIITSTYPEHLDAVIAAGLQTGQTLVGRDDQALVSMGPLKVITDGSLNTRTAHCRAPYADAPDLADPCGVQSVAPDQVAELARRATAAGLEVALHAIGDAAVAIAVDAAVAAGARGTLEHVQLIDWPDVGRMAQAGLAASVQPAHLLDDREATHRIWPDRADRCFVFASMARAGVALRFGSDAPVAPLDPWRTAAAAVHRGEPDDPPWNPAEALTPAQALAASVRSTLSPGQPADLVLVGDDPLRPAADSAEA